MIETLIEISGEEKVRRLMRKIGKSVGEELISNIKSRAGKKMLDIKDIERYVIPSLAELGSLPSLYKGEKQILGIRLSNCIFFELAQLYPNVVCEGHIALFQVIANAMGYHAHQKECMAKGDKYCTTVFLKKKQ